MRIARTCWILALAAAAAPLAARAAEGIGDKTDDAGIEFFEKKIRPVLVEHCFECHSADSKKLGGGLLLDSRAGIRAGGDSGPAITAGNPDESLLISAVRYGDDAVQMPPKGKLPAAVIADFEAWVAMGAPDPRVDAPKRKPSASWDEIRESRRTWWSLQPVAKPAVPTPRDAAWSQHPIDRFILAKLDEAKLAPAAPADPRTLARRLSLVLVGLPPGVDEVEAFVKEYEAAAGASNSNGTAPNVAVAKYVDSLLASPHFGERWARHWLDIVRFTETHGNEWNYEVHHAWRYRDYLIRAFNGDVPYDQFVREHIAGDLLEAPRWNAAERFNESVIGTGFYRFGEVNHDDCISLPQIGYDLADNQLDTLTKAFQATTVACARCHDHKLDAVSMRDYYALLGVLRSSRLVSHTLDAPEVNAEPIARLTELKRALRSELAGGWLKESERMGQYLLAAQAKRANRPDAAQLASGLDPQRLEKWTALLAPAALPVEDPLEPWRAIATGMTDNSAIAAQWSKLAEAFTAEERTRADARQTNFATYADFRQGDAGWQVGGQGLRSGAAASGDFAVTSTGDAVLGALLPAGMFTHLASDKLNGTLRSPALTEEGVAGKKFISFQVIGQRSSALRLVSNNCQLNYKNYKALTSADWQWVTFPIPPGVKNLRVYAELMTMFDNPKFPDQLSALGGDKESYRIPWEKAAENPRSYFGIAQAVLHDSPEPPKQELDHLRELFAGDAPASLTDVAARYTQIIDAAVRAWQAGKATDEQTRWLNSLIQRGLISTAANATPELESLVREYRAAEATIALPKVAAGVADFGAGFEQPLLIRGECTQPGDLVPRHYLEVLAKSDAPTSITGSGRLEIANRIASRENPLTARVMVNRVWKHLFGEGIVRSVDDFGHVGELPTHPELLDYLAAEFVDDGWSVKRLIRRLVLTRTFQLANVPSAEAKERDPNNRLLQHFPARRLEAEAIRDAMLATSGRLDGALFGLSIQPFREAEIADRRLFQGPLDGRGRRSIYIKVNLMESPKFLGAFNLPGGKVTQGRRDVTNVPAQALALLNDPFVLQQADEWAAKLVAAKHATVAERLEAMFLRALGRRPTAEETERFAAGLTELAALHQVPADQMLSSKVVWKEAAHAMFNLQEFIFIP